MKKISAALLTSLLLCGTYSDSARADSAMEILKDIEVHGFASASYNYNFHNPKSPTNGNSTNRIFDRDSNSFKFDVGELVLVRETPNVGDIGFRTDLTYGFSLPEVAKSTASAGDVQTHDFDLQQGYVSYRAPIGNGLQIDGGKFITHIGAEVIEGYDGWNSNISRSFMFGLAIPFTHTGVRAIYDVNEKVSVLGMIANGWDNTTDNNNDKTLGAQIAYAASDDVNILFNWAGGGASSANNNSDWRNIWDVVVDVALTDKTFMQLNFDYGTQESASLARLRDDAEWWGVAAILRHDYNKWFSMNARGEFFNDDDGFRANVTTGQKMWELTLTPEIRVNQNFVFRVEYRHDESTALAFNDGSNNQLNSSQDTVAANALFYF
ncbi:MAG: porin [Candidatus Nitrohelix vancouverensis]|uniref:Porin n=1 Tax=Candidatus Nitrohelix vancouverensis TaxID=2705534 RepID=A0A7T0C2Q1_9BACT|nr:MAG: porin [Candidatus Nitrohelix vancouverensis]